MTVCAAAAAASFRRAGALIQSARNSLCRSSFYLFYFNLLSLVAAGSSSDFVLYTYILEERKKNELK